MSLTNEQMTEALKRCGKPRGIPSPIEIDLQIARGLLESGFSMAQVGEYFGCASITVRRRLYAADKNRPVTPTPRHIYAANPGPDIFETLLNTRMKKEA